MELNLLPIMSYEGKKLEINEETQLSLSEADDFVLLSPVKFSGEAVNIGGTIELSGSGSAELELLCDRCADSFSQTVEFEVFERLKKEDEFSDGGEEDPEFIMFEGSSVDLDEIVYKNLYMNLPSKRLCDEDCKGLCSECGVNLNRESCNCSHEVTDPRFDILDKLL